MSHRQKFFLDGIVRFMELDKTISFGNEVWVNAVNISGETPLHIVARTRNLRLFVSMLPYYTDLEATNKAGNTVTHIFVDHRLERSQEHMRQRLDLLRILISKGADVNKRNKRGWTIVHFAAKHCHIDMLKYLAKMDADFNLQTFNDGTALLIVCKHMSKNLEETKTIEFLISLVPGINATDDEGYSALHYAAERCSIKTVIKLLNRGADLELRTKDHKLTPLHLAVKKEHNLAIVKLLLTAGAIVESPEIEELTPLHISLLAGSSDVVKHLVKSGADVNYLETYLQFTPLHLVIYKQRFDLLQLLIDNGVDVNGSGEDGLTPLHFSSMLGCLDSTKTLISLGARVNCYYNNQSTPLNLASRKNYVHETVKHERKRSLISKLLRTYPRKAQQFGAIIDMLLRKEAYPNVLTKSGWNLLHFLVELGPNLSNLVNVLYEHGANVHHRESNLGLTALHFASASNFISVAEVLIKAGANVSALNQSGQRPVHLALRSNCTEMLKLLIKYGAIVDCKETHSQLTPLHLALVRNYRHAAEVLINAGADVNQLTPDGRRPIHLALETNCVEVLKSLILRGANINCKEARSQYTPLHLALLRNHSDAAEVLINAGADVNALTRDGKSPLHLYLESNSFVVYYNESSKILKSLLGHGANVDYRETHSQLTPLHQALGKKYEDAAAILIDAGADVNAPTRDGKSPLHLAIETHCVEVLKPLMLRGANINYKEPHSELTPLHLALLKNHKDATEILISARADVNALTQNGLRPIHLALLANNTEVLKLLLEHGAYVDGKEMHSQLTPLHLALYKNYRVAAAILINASADVNALTVDGKSPLHLALESNCIELTKVLLKRGATLKCEGKRCLYTFLYITAQQNDECVIDDLEKSLIFRAMDAQEDREVKKAVFRLCAIADACNEKSCMNRNAEVDKCCNENSACLSICGVDVNDFEAYSKFISYRVLSGTFHEFDKLFPNSTQISNYLPTLKFHEINDRHMVNEVNSKYLSNYMSMLNAVDSPLARNYKTMKLVYAEGFFTMSDVIIYDKKCLDEVEKLKMYAINDGVTLYDVLQMRPKHRRFYTKNLNLFEIEFEFEIYYKLILANYFEDKIKTILMETVQLAIYRLTNVHLPIPLVEETFLDLSIVDVIATIEAAERTD